MYTFLLGAHNLLRWIIILFLVLNLIRHFAAINRPFINIDKRLALWLMFFAHLQLLIGLYQWFAGTYGLHGITNSGMAATMKNTTERFYTVEHTISMIVAILLITIARGIYRKNLTDGKKHRRCILLYMLALLIILAMMPWPGMDEIGRSFTPKFG